MIRRQLHIASLVGALTFGVADAAWSQWTQGAVGRTWVKATALFQETDRRFDELGRDTTWFPPSTSDNFAVFTDLIVGIHPRVDLYFQIPWWDLRFDTFGRTLSSTGIGDIRGWVRFRALDLFNGSTPVALRVGAKAPTGESPLDGEIVPVGDGQWDLDFFGEVGHSFWPFPAYAEIWLGYRVRFKSEEKAKDPGNEFVFLTEAGINPTTWSLLKVTLDGLRGGDWVIEGVQVTNARREITNLQFAGAVQVLRRLWIEGGIRIPLAGRNFPNGEQLLIALSSDMPWAR